MMDSTKGAQPLRLKLRITDLDIPDETISEMERLADQMADLADSIGYLDPLEAELSLTFDPKI
jgi:hypothetical protein